MEIIKLTPSVKDLIWGGTKLKNYGKQGDGKIAETWELSYHPAGKCLTPDGRALEEVATKLDLGKNVEGFDFFPMLIKFIDAADNLSVQVHPSDAYALENENQLGKTEMWYVVDVEPDCGIYMGFKRDVTPVEFASAIDNGTVEELLNFIKVKKGEHYFIKSGTVHAIGKGVTICEIQQNSNVTYRVYDYGRLGADGKPRELHVEKAKKVSNLNGKKPISPAIKVGNCVKIGLSKYFTVHSLTVLGQESYNVSEGSFCAVSVVEGEGKIAGNTVTAGDTYFIPASYGDVIMEGKMKVLLSEVRRYYAEAKFDGEIKAKVTDDLGCEIASGSAMGSTKEDADKLIESLIEKFGMDIADISNIEYKNF